MFSDHLLMVLLYQTQAIWTLAQTVGEVKLLLNRSSGEAVAMKVRNILVHGPAYVRRCAFIGC
jgi:hypothetical protein